MLLVVLNELLPGNPVTYGTSYTLPQAPTRPTGWPLKNVKIENNDTNVRLTVFLPLLLLTIVIIKLN